jgi:carbonic anhydrase
VLISSSHQRLAGGLRTISTRQPAKRREGDLFSDRAVGFLGSRIAIDKRVESSSMAAPMVSLEHLFTQNRAWADSIRAQDPEFFLKLSQQQSPEYLWIGCSDSRVPANEIVNLLPGEMFVHRNIANVVVHTDLNCLSVMQFAVDVLKVKHIIVCGHYGCSGVRAALRCDRIGLADNWLRHIQDVAEKYKTCIHAVRGEQVRTNRLCEFNVIEQTSNVCQTTIVRDAWERKQPLTIHGWIYGLKDGIIRNLGMSISSADEFEPQYRAALAAIESGEPFTASV